MQLDNGGNIKSADPRLARAYCEGIAFRIQGTALAYPITGNPYSVGTDEEIKNAWDNGWNFCNGYAGSALPQTNCAISGTVTA